MAMAPDLATADTGQKKKKPQGTPTTAAQRRIQPKKFQNPNAAAASMQNRGGGTPARRMHEATEKFPVTASGPGGRESTPPRNAWADYLAQRNKQGPTQANSYGQGGLGAGGTGWFEGQRYEGGKPAYGAGGYGQVPGQYQTPGRPPGYGGYGGYGGGGGWSYQGGDAPSALYGGGTGQAPGANYGASWSGGDAGTNAMYDAVQRRRMMNAMPSNLRSKYNFEEAMGNMGANPYKDPRFQGYGTNWGPGSWGDREMPWERSWNHPTHQLNAPGGELTEDSPSQDFIDAWNANAGNHPPGSGDPGNYGGGYGGGFGGYGGGFGGYDGGGHYGGNFGGGRNYGSYGGGFGGYGGGYSPYGGMNRGYPMGW